MKKKLIEKIIVMLCPSHELAEEVRVVTGKESLLRKRESVSMLEIINKEKLEMKDAQFAEEAAQLLELKCLIESYGDFTVPELAEVIDETGRCPYLLGNFPQKITQMRGLVEEFIGE